MAQPIRITVGATDTFGEDAPTVEDLLSQIQDLVSILHSIDEAVAGQGNRKLVWRVTNAIKESPITFELTPFPKELGVNIDTRAQEVVGATANGLAQLSEHGERPPYFADGVLGKAQELNKRVINGLSVTTIDFSEYKDAPQIAITRDIATRALEHILESKTPAPTRHRELGSIEGVITRVELDQQKKPLVWIRSRLHDQSPIKCIPEEHGLDRIGHLEVAEVLEGLRVLVLGLIHYRDVDRVDKIEVESVRVFEPDHELPNIDSIVSPNFTAGVESSEYLRTLREDG